MTIIAPSILSADFGNLAADIEAVTAAGADWIHIDVMDGHYVPPITIGAGVVKALRPIVAVPYDVHLMVSNPDNHIKDFAQAGADIITVHAEAGTHLHRTVQAIHEHGKKAGVALNPATPVAQLSKIIEDIELILIMTVNPGWGGQAYIDSMTAKIAETKTLIQSSGKDIYLEVDGGINEVTAQTVKTAGANVLVAGNYIFSKRQDYSSQIKSLR
ncbi:MAG: ribulose-phosphate 3-epimerase [Deltaproteobacteria bacterium]|nr:ribulose-phosphate 3-epimerase [Deltaproteobacteria bacterium]